MVWALVGRDDEVVGAVRCLTDPGGGVLVSGSAGVGRTRLLVEVANAATRLGFSPMWIVGSAAGRSIPFGAFAHVLRDEAYDDELLRLRHLYDELTRADRPEQVIVIDDAHLLDEASVALVHALVVHARARIVVAARSDSDGHGLGHSTLAALVKDGHLLRIDLAPLEREHVDALLASEFTGPLPEAMADDVWHLSAGMPIEVRAVVDASLEAGTLTPDGGGWRWDGPPVSAPTLATLVDERTSTVDESAIRGLELLSVAGPLPPTVASRVLCDDDLLALECAGLVAGDTEVHVTSPLVAAVVAANVSSTMRRAHGARLAQVWADSDHVDARREAARWALAAGLPVAPDEALSAARDALVAFDLPLAESLAHSAVAGRRAPDPEALLVLADALRGQARGEDALAALDRASVAAPNDDVAARVAIARADTISLVLGDLPAALAVLRAAAEAVADPAACQRVALHRTFLGAFAGDFRQVVEAAVDAESTPDAAIALDVVLLATFAQALSIRLDGMEERLARGAVLAAERQADAPFAGQQLGVCATLGRIGRARVAEAYACAAADLASTRTVGAPTGIAAVGLAFAGCFSGDIEAAAAAGVEAVESTRKVDPFGIVGLAASVGAIAAFQAGRPDDAKRLLGDAALRVGGDERARAVLAGRVAAWEAATSGSLGAAAARAADSGRQAVTASHCLWGAASLHDAVRFGDASAVVDDLAALALECNSPLVAAFGDHAAAFAGRDVDALRAVAGRFAAMGCRLFAADAEAQAAAVAADGGDGTSAAVLATRARVRWATCTGAESPALRAAPSGLSARQLDVARRASVGATSKAIAADLFVSVRTVDNHLRQAYRLLGVHGRDELAAVLDTGPGVEFDER